jgi:hypothetical protein
MWQSIFHLQVGLGEKILRSVLVYVFLLFALRFFGKRELGQANTLDLVVLLLVANAVQNGIIGNDVSVTGAVVGAVVLFGLNAMFARGIFRFPWLATLLEGEPSLLIEDGSPNLKVLRRECISLPELRSIARRAGVSRPWSGRLRDPRNKRGRDHVPRRRTSALPSRASGTSARPTDRQAPPKPGVIPVQRGQPDASISHGTASGLGVSRSPKRSWSSDSRRSPVAPARGPRWRLGVHAPGEGATESPAVSCFPQSATGRPRREEEASQRRCGWALCSASFNREPAEGAALASAARGHDDHRS